MRERGPERAWSIALHGLLGISAALLIFGDYLFLSASRLWSGAAGNWILMAAVVQLGALVTALFLGRLRGSKIDTACIGFLGLGAVMLIHLLDRGLSGARVESYAVQKVVAWFGICGPAMLLGRAIVRDGRLEGGRWAPWMIAPLLVMCALAIATDPTLLTVEHYLDLGVYFGVLVLPAHQALAFALAKACLLVFAFAQGSDSIRYWSWLSPRWFGWVGGGLLLGLACLTGARTYALALLIAVAAQWVFGRRRLLPALIGLALCVAIVHGLSSQFLVDRFDPRQLHESLAYLERQDAWRNAWNAFIEQPLLGSGPGGFAAVYGEESRVYPHNLALEVGSEFGLVGLCCLLMILGPAVVAIFRSLRNREQPSVVQFFALGFFAFALLGAMSVGDLIRNHFLFLACGLAAGSIRPSVRRAQRREPAPHSGLVGVAS